MSGKNVLVLGAGMISPPLLRYLLGRTRHHVTVAALDVSRAERVLEDFPRGRAVACDVTDPAVVEPYFGDADVVVSLLPADLSPRIAALAIRHRIPMIHTSYVSRAFAALDDEARSAGVLLLGETGLDPGFDHMSAIREIRRVHLRGGTVVKLLSCAGGLPAPDANDNPWGYKFSWFPRAVLVAARQDARFLRRGELVEIPGHLLFSNHWPYRVEELGVFELYPNRDSLPYRDAYGLRGVEGLFRGSLRHLGWCDTLFAVARLGLLEVEERDWPEGTTYADVAARLLPPAGGGVVSRVAETLGLDRDGAVMARLEWAGLFSDRPVGVRRAAPLDVLVGRLQRLMSYRPGERDLVVLEHRLTARFPDQHDEQITSSLVAYGERFGDSAMARTVSLPAAVATRLVLDGAVEAVGVQIPTLPELYRPILAELEEFGIATRERREVHYPDPLA